jgi:quercetin dioxygenase-like cupin family protein
MHKKTVTLLMAGAVGLPAAGLAFATPPSGLTSELLARGAGGELRIHDDNLRLRTKRPTDVALVRATLQANGSTGWHEHPNDSLVVVKSGAITMYEPGRRGKCKIGVFGPGSVFVHPEGEHNFVNETTGVAELYVVYMVPTGVAPLLTDVPTAPSECS